MIHIEKLTVNEFRGIRHIELDLKRKNFAVCGPNGTGKSGIVDALEFVLTGTVSRLTGKGRGELSVKEHGPHVDSRTAPEKAYVEAVVFVPSLKQHLTIHRSVKSPKVAKLTPDTADTKRVITQLEAHPEIALSRREIIRYVLTEPGQRSKDVQALLKLDELEELRSRLLKISNAAAGQLESATRTRTAAQEALIRAMGISSATVTEVVAAANVRRKSLGLEPLTNLNGGVSLRDGLATSKEDSAPRFTKAAAAADAKAAYDAFDERASVEFKGSLMKAHEAIEGLKADSALLDAVTRDDFLKTALELYDGEHCPACDTGFEGGEFIEIVAVKRAKLVEVQRMRAAAEALLTPIAQALDDELAAFRLLFPYAKVLVNAADLQIIKEHGSALRAHSDALKAFVPLDATLETLNSLLPKDVVREVLGRLDAAVKAMPDPSQQTEARDYLTIAQERLETLQRETANFRTRHAQAAKAKRVLEIYADTQKAALEKVYEDVQTHFAELYRQINADDESTFTAALTPSLGKLGFNVDFYKRGFFPPGAYHSEGHQDSMGLCLYLALMKYLLGDAFTFAVLDDVLMSVDAGHRREVSRMLKSAFPSTQFILTTHDKVWLKHMSTAGLIAGRGMVHFRKWTVADGPSAWDGDDVWGEIEAYAKNDDVRSAAALMRNNLEYLSAEFCDALRARVEFSADGRHDLGELLVSATTRLKTLLAEALSATQTWGDAVRITQVQDAHDAIAKAAQDALGEQWQTNAAIHHNDWADLHKNDFLPVVAAFKALTAKFACPTCKGLIAVSPSGGSKEHLICGCSAVAFSFKKKPKAAAG